jgi:hypothetical protein
MIITLISFAILFIGISLLVLYKVCDKKCCKSPKVKRFCLKIASSYLDIISGVILIVGFGAAFACSLLAISNTVTKQVEFEKVLYEKKTIEYRIEHQEDNTVGNELLYEDIIEFNNNLRLTRYWANNPWTNWFNNDKVADLGYIEYEFAED